MLLYKPPDAAHDYKERLRCEKPDCQSYLSTTILHRSAKRPALTLQNYIRLFTVRGCGAIDETIARHFTTLRTWAALSHLAFPICNHLCTSDTRVQYHFNRFCLALTKADGSAAHCTCYGGNTRIPFHRIHYRRCAKCEKEGCYTSWGFETQQDFVRDGNGMFVKEVSLYLVAFRDLGGMENSSEPGWRLHTLDCAGIERMQQQWNAWMEFVRSTGADWEQRPVRTLLERLQTRFKESWRALR